MDIQNNLFEVALSIEAPLYVENVEFKTEEGELHVSINFKKGAKFTCASCGKEHCSVHDTTEKTWRHLNFFQHKAFIHFRTPSTKCPDCGVKLYVPAWARSRSGFTLLFEAYVLTLAKSMPMSAVEKLVDEHDTLLWRFVKAHVKKAYEEKDLSSVTQVGIDETSTKKGHNYMTVFMDMEKREVVYATEGKGKSTVEKFVDVLPKHGGDATNIKEVSMDMSPSFITGVTEHLPEAGITFDKFHVIQALNKAMDEIRRNETKLNPCLKGTRYLWLKNTDKLTEEQKKTVKTLSKENKKLGKAYQMKMTLQDIYKTIKDPETADFALKKWMSWGIRSRQEPIKNFVKMLRRHYNGILRYFKSGLTAGASEGMNSRIQEIKRRAKGFRNLDNFITIVYLQGAGLVMPAFG